MEEAFFFLETVSIQYLAIILSPETAFFTESAHSYKCEKSTAALHVSSVLTKQVNQSVMLKRINFLLAMGP